MAPTDHPIVNVDPEALGGTPVFRGTRVPIAASFDLIEGGETVGTFLKGFPAVNRGQVFALLALAKQRILAA